MSESIKELDVYNMMPTRLERLKVFIGDHIDENEREIAQDIA
jgi:hypothetical protein